MRYMIIVKATKDSEAGVLPPADMLEKMAAYHGELAKAGVLVDGSGLQATSKGWRIRYRGAARTVVDGPFAETKELIAGFTLWGNEVSLPGLTSSATASTYCSAPNSIQILPAYFAIRRYAASFLRGTGSTNPST